MPVRPPVRRFVIDVGPSAGTGPVCRVEDPARLLRLWSLLQAMLGQLDGLALPPGKAAGLQRQLQAIRGELDLAVSPPLVAELRRILPSPGGEPSADTLRIECAALVSWTGGLVLQMLSVFTAALDQAQQDGPGWGNPAPGERPQAAGTFAPGALSDSAATLGA